MRGMIMVGRFSVVFICGGMENCSAREKIKQQIFERIVIAYLAKEKGCSFRFIAQDCVRVVVQFYQNVLRETFVFIDF